MPSGPPSSHCLKALRGSVTCMKSLGLDAVGGWLEPRPSPQPLELCSFCSISPHRVEKLLQGNKFGSGKGEMMAGEGGESWNPAGDWGGWGGLQMGGWDTRVPGWLGLGPALPSWSGLGLQAASAPPSRPPESPKSNIPPPLLGQSYCL